MSSTVKVMSGWLSMSKKSAERSCLSRLAFSVSTDAATTAMAPLTSPVGETVPWPVTWRKTPFTGPRPHRCLLFSETVDRDGSRIHRPASAAPFSSSCGSGAASCSDGVMVFSYRCASGSARTPHWVGRRARQRGGVEVPDLVDALGEPPAVAGAPVAVVVDGVVQVRAAVAQADDLLEVGPPGRGV